MRIGGSRGVISLILFLIVGAFLGSIIGGILESSSIEGIMPYLVTSYQVFDLKDIMVNLGIIKFHFGIQFALIIAANLYVSAFPSLSTSLGSVSGVITSLLLGLIYYTGTYYILKNKVNLQ